MTLEAKIEAVLFFKAEPLSTARLGKILGASEEDIENALASLFKTLASRGIRLIVKDEEVMLGTAPELADVVQAMRKDEEAETLSPAALETLSIVLYKGPVGKSDIDYIRGVNSNFILRSLLIRGLIEKAPSPDGARAFLYRPTFDLLSHMGVVRSADMPEYEETRQKIEESVRAEKPTEE
jgi:segregation and condensation protein B